MLVEGASDNQALPEGTIDLIRFSGNIAGTFYLSDIRLVTSAPVPTAVAEEYQAAAPAPFALGQNQPNPFNSDTTIRYSLPQAGEVELAIYNLAGQQVAQLVRALRPPGRHAVRWDGRDDQGQALPPGIYLVRVHFSTDSDAPGTAVSRLVHLVY